MIGYMKPYSKKLSNEHKKQYKKYYCGLCRSIKRNFGVTAVPFLNYELVNMLLLLGALRPEKFETMTLSCSLTPLYWNKICTGDDMAFNAAARVSMIMAFLEIHDNLIDSGELKYRLINMFMSKKCKKILSDFYNEYDIIKNKYDSYMVLENTAKKNDTSVTIKALSEACGDIAGVMAEIVAQEEQNSISEELKDIMYLWGEWTYLVDAADDYIKDKKNGAFNPLFISDGWKTVSCILEDIEKKSAELLDKMTLIRNQELLITIFKEHFPERRENICNKLTISLKNFKED